MKDGLRRRLTDSVETAAQPRRRPRRDRAGRRAHAHLLREVRLPPLRHLAARDPAAHLLVQQPARRLPGLPRPGLHAGDRPDLVVPDHSLSASTRARCCRSAAGGRLDGRQAFQAVDRALRGRPRHAVGGAAARSSATCSSTAPRDAHRHALPQLRGPHGGTTRPSSAGILKPTCERRYEETESELIRQKIEEYMAERPVRGVPRRAAQAHEPRRDRRRAQHPPVHAHERARGAAPSSTRSALTDTERLIGGRVIKEIRERLAFLATWASATSRCGAPRPSLSGGEAQRIRLATQIGSALVGVLYILDEPSIGLHQRDNRRLIDTLLRLRDLGNTVIVVEHDEETMRSADHLVDMGPGAGEHGGRVVAQGPPVVHRGRAGLAHRRSTWPGGARIELPGQRRLPLQWLTVRGASHAQPQAHRRGLPAGRLHAASPACRARASPRWSTRSSTRARRRASTAAPRLRARGARRHRRRSSCSTRSSTSTSRPSAARRAPTRPPTRASSTTSASSSPQTPEIARCAATSRGASASTSRAGAARPARATARSRSRCTSCPTSTCPARSASGKRYNRDTLEVRYKGKNIAEVLDMSVEEARGVLRQPAAHRAPAARR